jgi:hypothetical protein
MLFIFLFIYFVVVVASADVFQQRPHEYAGLLDTVDNKSLTYIVIVEVAVVGSTSQCYADS